MLTRLRAAFVRRFQEEEIGFKVTELPTEILVAILVKVDPVDLLLSCSLVCKRFRDIIGASEFWSDLFASKYGSEKLNFLRSHLPQYDINFKQLVVYQAFEKNLILNPAGEEKNTDFWEMVENGGNRLIIESRGDSRGVAGVGVRMSRGELEAVDHPQWLELPSKSCFVSSYMRCTMHQIIDLEECGFQSEIFDVVKPPIAVGAWTAARWDCGGEYSVEVVLLGEDGKKIDVFQHTIRMDEDEQRSRWIPISHVFTDYENGVRKISFRQSSVDTRFWRGHFGAKFTNATVKVLFSSPS